MYINVEMANCEKRPKQERDDIRFTPPTYRVLPYSMISSPKPSVNMWQVSKWLVSVDWGVLHIDMQDNFCSNLIDILTSCCSDSIYSLEKL